jgi:hypothetical protein
LFRVFLLYDPPVNAKKKEKVAALLRLYLGKDTSAEPSERAAFGKSTIHSKIFTAAMLNPQNEKPVLKRDSGNQHSQDNKYSADQAPVIDEWTLCSGIITLSHLATETFQPMFYFIFFLWQNTIGHVSLLVAFRVSRLISWSWKELTGN